MAAKAKTKKKAKRTVKKAGRSTGKSARSRSAKTSRRAVSRSKKTRTRGSRDAPAASGLYTVRSYRGDYRERQEQANADDAKAYVEHHFNSCESPTAGYAMAITGSNGSQTSRNWARWYAQAVSREFGIPLGGDQGVVVGGYGGRGDYNLRFTSCPAILLEPLFASNPLHGEWIRSESGQERLARVLAESIQRFFPPGSLIAFSVGHKYKTSRPADRGAQVFGGGREADYAEAVLEKARKQVEALEAPSPERPIRVMLDDQVIFEHAVDPDADVTWDPLRSLLNVRQP